MSREYRRIEQYEEEILCMRREGYTRREICEKYGFKMKQLVNFITRYNRKHKRIAAGIALRKKGRPSKDCVVSKESKSTYGYRRVHIWLERHGMNKYKLLYPVTTYDRRFFCCFILLR